MKQTRQYRVTRFDRKGKQHVAGMSERQLWRFRAKRFQSIRKQDLGLSQKAFADAVGINVRTLQDWELGRSPMPKPVEIILSLMREMPSVRKRLIKSGTIERPPKDIA
jgi:DNA-binding transcriptional regulator YiaG